jgi:hypothetical protein
MNKKLIYIGLDVDDTQYHGAAFDKETSEIVSFKCRPNLKGLVLQLEKMQKYFVVGSLKHRATMRLTSGFACSVI